MEVVVHTARAGGKPEKLTVQGDAKLGELLERLKGQEAPAAGRSLRVIHQGKVLNESQAALSLKDAGLAHGDALMVLTVGSIPSPSAPQTHPAPNNAAIESALLGEARKRGIPMARRSGRPAPSHAFLSPELAGIEEPLLQLLNAFQPGRGPGASLLAADPVAAAMQQLATALDVPMADLHGGARPSRRQRDDEEEEEDEEEMEEEERQPAEIRPPEPPAHLVEQLMSMGFQEPVVRKALVLGRNNLENALEWLLAHAEDPDAAEPPTQQQLRQVYGAPSQSIVESNAIDQLCEMGFERPAVAAAVRRFRNVELALAYLLQTASSAPAPPPAPSSQSRQPPSSQQQSAATPSQPQSEAATRSGSTQAEGRAEDAAGHQPGRAGEVASALEAAAAPSQGGTPGHGSMYSASDVAAQHGAQSGDGQGQQQQQQQQQDVDMDAHRQEGGNAHGQGSQEQEEINAISGLLQQVQQSMPPQLISSLEGHGVPIDPQAILGGNRGVPQGQRSFMGVPLPANMAAAMQAAEEQLGDQQNMHALAHQLGQLEQQLTGGSQQQQQQQQQGGGDGPH